MLSARHFARLCAGMGWDLDESVNALVEDHHLPRHEARALMNAELRKRQELDIEDVHDELEEQQA